MSEESLMFIDFACFFLVVFIIVPIFVVIITVVVGAAVVVTINENWPWERESSVSRESRE